MRSGWPHPPARKPLLETVLPLRKSCDSKNITILQTCVSIHRMHIKRWRRLRDGAPAPWQADTNAYKQRFWCHDRPRSEKNGGFGYARGIFHEETMSVYR